LNCKFAAEQRRFPAGNFLPTGEKNLSGLKPTRKHSLACRFFSRDDGCSRWHQSTNPVDKAYVVDTDIQSMNWASRSCLIFGLIGFSISNHETAHRRTSLPPPLTLA